MEDRKQYLKEYNKKWYQKNKEKKKQYYIANREKILNKQQEIRDIIKNLKFSKVKI